MRKIFVAGSINMDLVARTSQYPQPGETVFGYDLHYVPGGKGSNQAVSASRLSDHVYLIGKLGHDSFGNALTDFLKAEELNLDYLLYSDEHPSGVAFITVNDASENTIVVVSGSNFALSAYDIETVKFTSQDIVSSVFEIPQPTIRHLFSRAKASGAKTILNPAPASAFIDGLLPLVDYLIINETELTFFAGKQVNAEDVTTMQRYIESVRATPKQTIIVTLGAKGIVCIYESQVIRIEGIAVDAVDTTGAGDCFIGAFIVGVSEGMSLRNALQFANAAASLSVQKLGASASMPQRQKVNAQLPK